MQLGSSCVLAPLATNVDLLVPFLKGNIFFNTKIIVTEICSLFKINRSKFDSFYLNDNQYNDSNVIPILLILQNVISASQCLVKMKEFAVIPPAVIRADARMIILGRTVIVGVNILLLCIICKYIFINSYKY